MLAEDQPVMTQMKQAALLPGRILAHMARLGPNEFHHANQVWDDPDIQEVAYREQVAVKLSEMCLVRKQLTRVPVSVPGHHNIRYAYALNPRYKPDEPKKRKLTSRKTLEVSPKVPEVILNDRTGEKPRITVTENQIVVDSPKYDLIVKF